MFCLVGGRDGQTLTYSFCFVLFGALHDWLLGWTRSLLFGCLVFFNNALLVVSARTCDGARCGCAQAKAEYAPYYRNSLLFLACVDTATDMSAEERLQRAHDLGIAAFLGDTIYNFGELVRVFFSYACLSLSSSLFPCSVLFVCAGTRSVAIASHRVGPPLQHPAPGFISGGFVFKCLHAASPNDGSDEGMAGWPRDPLAVPHSSFVLYHVLPSSFLPSFFLLRTPGARPWQYENRSHSRFTRPSVSKVVRSLTTLFLVV